MHRKPEFSIRIGNRVGRGNNWSTKLNLSIINTDTIIHTRTSISHKLIISPPYSAPLFSVLIIMNTSGKMQIIQSRRSASHARTTSDHRRTVLPQMPALEHTTIPYLHSSSMQLSIANAPRWFMLGDKTVR